MMQLHKLILLTLLATSCRSRDGEFWDRPDLAHRDASPPDDLTASPPDLSFSIDLASTDLAITPRRGWPMYRHDGQARAREDLPGPIAPARRWQLAMTSTAPLVGSDGTVFVPSDVAMSTVTFALDPVDGHTHWATPGIAPLALAPDGTVYAFTVNGNPTYVVALDPAGGGEKWRTNIIDAPHSNGAVGPDGTLYLDEGMGFISAIAPNGIKRGLGPFGSSRSIVTLGIDGAVYAWRQDVVDLNAMNSNDGKVRWTHTGVGAPAVRPDGVLLVLDQAGGNLLELDPKDGHTIATHLLAFPSTNRPVIALDGSMRLYNMQGISALSAGFQEMWIQRLMNEVVSTQLTLDVNGNTYFGTDAGRIYSIDAAGNSRWSADVGAPVNTSELVLDGTALCVGLPTGLFALGK